VQVVRVTPDLATALAPFFREAWGDVRSADQIRADMLRAAAENPSVPGADLPATAFINDGSVIGYIGTIPATFWNGSVAVQGHWLKGFMVLEAFRSGPVGFAVLKELLKHVGVSGIITVAPPARRLFGAVGYKDCGTLPNYLTPLRSACIARSLDIAALGLGIPSWLDWSARLAQRIGLAGLAGSFAGVGLSALRATRGSARGLLIDTGGTLPADAELDVLWNDARSSFVSGAVRDGAFLPWRYSPRPAATYEAATVREGTPPNRVVAVAIVRRPAESPDPRLRGIKVASLSDILFRADAIKAGLAAVAGAERIARRMGADALLCTASHPAIQEVLRRRSFLRLPGNVHLMIRDPKSAAGLALDAESWWVTRGDASSDEVF
jgi:hypothetical protein